MKAKRRRQIFYGLLYTGTAILALSALTLSIKTMILHHENQALKTELQKIDAENKALNLKILQESRLEKVDTVATQKLNMIHPKAPKPNPS